MPRFFYIARDKTGKKVTSFDDAVNQEELIRRLQAKDLLVVSVSLKTEETSDLSEKGVRRHKSKHRHYRITNQDLVIFCRQLATLLAAGVTILKSLEVISEQVASQKLYKTINELKKQMEAGLSLYEAMAKYPYVFSELWVNLVESGEASGNLALVLGRLASYLERMAAFRSRIISALLYPTILLIAGIGALLFLTIKIIPTFTQLFSGFNIKLPLLTIVLINISNFIRKYLFLMMIIIGIGFWLFKNYIKTKTGRRQWENFKFRLPVFGEFFRALVVERFSSNMATLIESGVPVLYSLEICEHSVGNLVMAEVIRRVKENIRDGKSLTLPLEESGFFEPMVLQMVHIGEEIGELAPMFKKINAFYQEYVETFLNRFTTLFEPMMLIFMGIVIGIMVIGMFLPIFQIARISG